MLTYEEAKKLDLEKIARIHMIGINTPFSSFCARKLISLGKNVTASEIDQDHPSANAWIDEGILFPGGHNEKFITNDIDLVIYPNGPIPDNPECKKTENLGIPAITNSMCTGVVTRELKTIAIIGTHGKTTTTALVAWVMGELGEVPNYILDQGILNVPEVIKNWNVNPNSQWFVVEACEYKNQFLGRASSPLISVVTHIGLDHTDFFPTQEQYNLAFENFLLNTKATIVADLESNNEKMVLERVQKSKPELKVINVADSRQDLLPIESPLIGKFNQENLIRAVLACECEEVGLKRDQLLKKVKTFPGVAVRFQHVGEMTSGAEVFLDYAHNPEKVRAMLDGAREAYPNHKIILVLQPHTHERAHTFRLEFANAIKNANAVIVPNIFTHRRESEEVKKLISAEQFSELLKEKNPKIDVRFMDGFEATASFLKKQETNEKTLVILASAGDLYKMVPLIVKPTVKA